MVLNIRNIIMHSGISLSVDQWEMLKGAIPEIDSKIQSK